MIEGKIQVKGILCKVNPMENGHPTVLPIASNPSPSNAPGRGKKDNDESRTSRVIVIAANGMNQCNYFSSDKTHKNTSRYWNGKVGINMMAQVEDW